MDGNNSLIAVLALFTIVTVLVIAIWQRARTIQAFRDGERSAVTTGKAEPKV